MDIARLPPEVFKAPQSYMFTIAGWSALTSYDSHVQIDNGSSVITVLNTGNGTTYKGQLTIML